MNEPAIFYSEKHLKEVFEKMEDYKKMNLDVNTFFEMTGMIGSICNNPEDYASFYHNYKGKRYRHDQVHNLFGYYMTRSASEAFERYVPEREFCCFPEHLILECTGLEESGRETMLHGGPI